MKGIFARIAAVGLLSFVSACTHAAQGKGEGERHEHGGRRYLNEVFSDHVRTADIVFAEEPNRSPGALEKLTMRVFEPKADSAERRALLVLTPGGAFVRHEDHWMDEFGEQLARAGYVVAIHRYRLSDSIATAEEYHDALSKAFSDQKSVIRYFVQDARGENRFRIDRECIFVGGHSAGGIASMHVAYLDADDPISEPMREALLKPAGIHGGSGDDDPSFKIRGVINLSGMLTDLSILDQKEPPLLSLHGDGDQVVAIGETPGRFGSAAIHEKARQIGLPSEMYTIRGAGHNDTSDPVLCPECIPLIRRFMFTQLARLQ